MISVIVPIYKVEKYLRRCVDSILAQTYSDLEVILVDDGSPDGCPEICDAYREKDHRVKVIHQENSGLSAARNSGLDICTGEYITFVDSDDWLHLQMLERLWSVINTSPEIGMVTCGFSRVFEDDIPEETIARQPAEVFSGKDTMERFYDANGGIYAMVWAKLYRRALFRDIRFPVGRLCEDDFVTHKLIMSAGRCAILKEKLYFYFARNDSISGAATIKMRTDALDAKIEKVMYFRQLGMRSLSVMAFNDAEWWVEEKISQYDSKSEKRKFNKGYKKVLKAGLGVLPLKQWIISAYRAMKIMYFGG